MSTESADRTVTVERSYLVRVVQEYRATVPVDLNEGSWQFDQFVCDQGELIVERTELIEDDQLEWSIVRAPGRYRLVRTLQNGDVSTRLATLDSSGLWTLDGSEYSVSEEFIRTSFGTIERVGD